MKGDKEEASMRRCANCGDPAIYKVAHDEFPDRVYADVCEDCYEIGDSILFRYDD